MSFIIRHFESLSDQASLYFGQPLLFKKTEFYMIPSRYNQISPVKENIYAIYNPLSGAFDLAASGEKERFEKGWARDEAEKEYWINRGYYFENSASEEAYIKKRYQDFLEESENNGVQFLLVLSYGCNFHCPYCYQKDMAGPGNLISLEMIEAFFRFVLNYRLRERKEVYVTLFGGEPLSPAYRKELVHIVKLAALHKIPLSVVSNGYYLKEYLPLLSQAVIHEIQVTLDGDEELHNKRRYAREGENSFDKILSGVKEAARLSLPIHIRLMIDKQTLPTLPGLALKLDEAGLLDLPPHLFKTSLGRNYELIDSYSGKQDIYALDEMYGAYALLMKREPLVQKLYNPGFFGIKNMVLRQEMYLPSFDTCPAGKSEFVFDNSGKIYGCTASCGREGYELGEYYPKLVLNEGALKEWKSRNILTIPECRDCSVGVVCGGGCGVIAKNTHGKVLAPDCKPIKNIFDTGIAFYEEEILKLLD